MSPYYKIISKLQPRESMTKKNGFVNEKLQFQHSVFSAED